MELVTQQSRDSRLGSIFESATLISITLLFIGLYLYYSGAMRAGWVVLFLLMAVIGVIASIAASYNQISREVQLDQAVAFRISRQLVETLKAKETPPDVIFGLEELLNKRGKVTASSEKELWQLLTDTFGWERTKEIDQLIMKYALVHPTPDQAT